VIIALVLPWFPIILAVGVGGRLLDRTRGFGLGVLGALFWLLLVQVSAGVTIWGEPLMVVSLLAGVFTIVAMGGWAGESPLDRGDMSTSGSGETGRPADLKATFNAICSPLPNSGSARADTGGDASRITDGDGLALLDRISTMVEQFDDWLDAHRDASNPWGKFDEFIRTALYRCCRATHVKPYRVCGEGGGLKALREPDPFSEIEHVSSRKGIVGHVATTGRSYLAGDGTQGELLSQLADESEEPVAWCFAIRQGPRKIGTVVVGQLDLDPLRNRPLLHVAERLVAQFWCTLFETTHSRQAALDDPVSGTFNREGLLRVAEQSLQESYQLGEPVAVAVIALEGLRELNDSGRWEIADELVREVGHVLSRKIRMDDRLGRFDGSRFVLLIRRVDAELASLIVTQIMSQLRVLYDDIERWQTKVVARCGVVGSGTEKPTLRTLVSQALTQCRKARLENALVSSHLRVVPESTAGQGGPGMKPVFLSANESVI